MSSPNLPPDTLHADRHNRRIGLMLFTAYLLIYVGFIVIVYLDYRNTARPSLLGLNVAIVYGFALILSAFILALIYLSLAKKN